MSDPTHDVLFITVYLYPDSPKLDIQGSQPAERRRSEDARKHLARHHV